MQKGRDFLRAQISNAVMQHRMLLENLEAHEKQAEDPRYRDLCSSHIPRMRDHQRMLEEYRRTLGEGAGGGIKEAVGGILGKARDAVDAVRGDDFLRLVGNIVEMRQGQDTFAVFAAAGDQLGDARLAEIGRKLEHEHDQMQRLFNDLSRRMFVERAGSAMGDAREAAAAD